MGCLNTKEQPLKESFDRLMPFYRRILAVSVTYFLEKKKCLIILGAHKKMSVFFIEVAVLLRLKN
jgi:hypothetical protein